MLYTDRIKNLTAAYPKLSRVWIKSADSRTPLKSVWIDETKLEAMGKDIADAPSDGESCEVSEDHLLLAA
jgi:hypothetical protein